MAYVAGFRRYPPSPWGLASHLSRFGFPTTPGTASFLLRRFFEEKGEEPRFPLTDGPTLGATVLSFGFVPKEPDANLPGAMLSAGMEDRSFLNKDLQRVVLRAQAEHREWWGQFVNLPTFVRQGREPSRLAKMVDRHLEVGKPTRQELRTAAIAARCDELGVERLDWREEDEVEKALSQMIADRRKNLKL
jgi:hypothetical protein